MPEGARQGRAATLKHYSRDSDKGVWRLMDRFGSYRERRRRRAQALYRFEMTLREEGEVSDLVYDEEQDLFRFPDGRFAFSKEYANVKLLEERGYFG